MIVDSAQHKAERIRKLENWHRRFAWLPVVTQDGDTVWLCFVERRLKGGEAHYDFDGLIPSWEYRR